MTTGKGPAPLGVVIVELNVIEVDPWVDDHRELAAREGGGQSVAGGAPFGPRSPVLDQGADLGAPTPPLVTGA